MKVHWPFLGSDHAITSATVQVLPIRREKKFEGAWQCDNAELAQAWILRMAPQQFDSLQQFLTFVEEFQREFDAGKNRSQKRQEREPPSVKALRRLLAIETDQYQRRALKTQIWQSRKAWLHTLKLIRGRPRIHDIVFNTAL